MGIKARSPNVHSIWMLVIEMKRADWLRHVSANWREYKTGPVAIALACIAPKPAVAGDNFVPALFGGLALGTLFGIALLGNVLSLVKIWGL